MFFITKNHSPGREICRKNLLDLLKVALDNVDPWRRDWLAVMRADVRTAGADLFRSAAAYLSDLSDEEVFQWMLQYLRFNPIAQAIWLMGAHEACPALRDVVQEKQRSLEHDCPDCLPLLGNLQKWPVDERLPESVASGRTGTVLGLHIAGFFLTGHRDVLSLVRGIMEHPEVEKGRASQVWRRAARAVEELGIEPVRCRPEVLLLLKTPGIAEAALSPDAAGVFFDLEGVSREYIDGIAGTVANRKLADLGALLSQGRFAEVEKWVSSCFGGIPKGALPEDLKRMLRERWMLEDPFAPNDAIRFPENWTPMSPSLADWLDDWFGIEPPQWALGEEKALLLALASTDFVARFPMQVLQGFAQRYGLPALKVLAGHVQTQKITVKHPEAYEDLDPWRVFTLMPDREAFERILLPRLDDRSFHWLLDEKSKSKRQTWLAAYVSGRPAPECEALTRELIGKYKADALRWVMPDNPLWLELGLETILQPVFWQVVEAQASAVAELKGRTDAFIKSMPKGAGKQKKVRLSNTSPEARMLAVLMNNTSLRRRCVTDHLDDRMAELSHDWWRGNTRVMILGCPAVSLRQLMTDMLISKTFKGSDALRSRVFARVMEESEKKPGSRMRHLALALRSTARFDVFNVKDVTWSREELVTAASLMKPACVDGYLKQMGDEGYELLYERSPDSLVGCHWVRFCSKRVREGLSLPVRRHEFMPESDEEINCEEAAKVFRLADGLTRSRVEEWLERLGRHARDVLEIVRSEASEVLPERLNKMLDEARARLDIEPEARLEALMAAGRAEKSGESLRWWPPEGPSGKDGLVYGALRSHHLVTRVAAAWPEDEAAAKRTLSLMQECWAHDAAWVEIALAIGLENAPVLRELIGRTDWQKDNGERYDGCYARYRIPKKNGGEREIHAPCATLKTIQTLVNERILQPLGAHDAAWGFVPGRSIAGNASCHVGKPIVACADIHSCFPSVGRGLVISVLRRDLGDRFSDTAILRLADIALAEGVLPTGAPTSPALLNRVLLRTDEILTDAAEKRGCAYTRYADDLVFSGGEEAVGLLGVAKGVLRGIGLELDPKKTNVFRKGRRQCCTGLVVNEKVGVRRDYARRLRAAVHAVACGRQPELDGRPLSMMMLKGHIAFLESVKPEEGARLRERLAAAIVR